MHLSSNASRKHEIVSNLSDTAKHHICRLTSYEPSPQKPYLYLITTHFNGPTGNANSSIEQNLDHVSSSTNQVYNHILNNTVRRHKYKSRKKYHPFMMSFIDFAGTRTHKARFTELPHIHSVLVVHPSVNPRFQTLASKGFRILEDFHNTTNIRDIDVVEIEQTDGDIRSVIDYSAKSYLMDYIPNVSKETQANMMILNG